jgi:N-acyl homoserine lactone hydrolase
MSRSVHRLHLATSNYLDGRIEVFGYLVLGGTDVVLVDTGIGEGNEYIDRLFAPDRTPIRVELERFGLEPGDVNKVVNSHLHFDHCGNNRLFPHADIFVQADELEAARVPRYTVTEWFDYEGARLNRVSGDMEIGDGVKLVASPGHTPGHQSVLVETDDHTVLITGQAAHTAAEYERGGDTGQAHPGLETRYLDSISKLKSVGAEQVYFGHDATAVTRRRA